MDYLLIYSFIYLLILLRRRKTWLIALVDFVLHVPVYFCGCFSPGFDFVSAASVDVILARKSISKII